MFQIIFFKQLQIIANVPIFLTERCNWQKGTLSPRNPNSTLTSNKKSYPKGLIWLKRLIWLITTQDSLKVKMLAYKQFSKTRNDLVDFLFTFTLN